jgi:hypothetical protein
LPSSGAVLPSRLSKVNAGVATRSVCKRTCARRRAPLVYRTFTRLMLLMVRPGRASVAAAA